MRDALICAPIRTPVGRFGGWLREVTAAQLASTVISELVRRTGVPEGRIEDVIFGQGYPSAESPGIGRVAALDAGLPVSVAGLQIDRRCGSALQALIYAAMCVQTCMADVVIAGGAESMSQVEYYSTDVRWGARSGNVELLDRLVRGRVTVGGKFHPVAGGMIETAENLRREYRITRERQDLLAESSHRRAIEAQRSGIFVEEIVPVTTSSRRGEVVIDTDEHPRADVSVETLATLRAIRSDVDVDATVTAGNSSGQNDGAAACLVVSPQAVKEYELKPLARLRSWAVAGVEPARMGIGPVPATRIALARAGLNLSNIDLIEINEAFAAQVLACTAEWGLEDCDERVNVHGSGISLGHPIGATGARIAATLLREMGRRDATFGLETLCVGGGQGIAAVFERV